MDQRWHGTDAQLAGLAGFQVVDFSAQIFLYLAQDLVARIGRNGQKTAAGFYRYEGREALDDTRVIELIRGLAQRAGVMRRSDITDTEIVDRCITPLIDEGHRILEEGIAERASDIDGVRLNGYGFPPDLGGPMFYEKERAAMLQGLK